MADASCSGPSPFKRLVDQQNRDVSHHQDRLVGNAPNGPQGSFRSQPIHPAQGQNGFGAFMDGSTAHQMPGHPQLPLHHNAAAAGRLAAHAAALDPQLHHANQPNNPSFQQTGTVSPAPNQNWAADFSRFASQQQQQQHPSQAHLPPAQQHHRHLPSPQVAPQFQHDSMAAAFGFQPQSSMAPNGGFSPLYGPTNGGFMDPNMAAAQRPAAESDFDQEMSRWMATHGASSSAGNGNAAAVNAKAMEDVDAVMEQMARELELNDQQLVHDEAGLAVSTEQGLAQENNTHLTDLESTELGSLHQNEELLPEQTVEQTPAAEVKGRSEVSEAAERLLESVEHEDGEKWKNSVFLSLMRDFRDGRKDIVDNEVRDTPENGVAGENAEGAPAGPTPPAAQPTP